MTITAAASTTAERSAAEAAATAAATSAAALSACCVSCAVCAAKADGFTCRQIKADERRSLTEVARNDLVRK